MLKAIKKIFSSETRNEKAILPPASSETGKDQTLKSEGDAYLQSGEFAKAAHSYEQALSINPNLAKAHCNLGFALKESGALDKAAIHLKRALGIDPTLADAHYILGLIAREKSQIDEAARQFENALSIDKEFEPAAQALCELCFLFFQRGDIKKAKGIIQHAITIAPHVTSFHFYLGNICKHENELEQALSCYETALSLTPDHSEVHYNAALVWEQQRDWQQAIEHYEKAALKPDFIDAKWNLAHAHLITGNLEKGFALYDVRLDATNQERFAFIRSITAQFPGKPRWNGENLTGKSLLVWIEQGLGDALMMLRFLPLLKQKGASEILFLCPPDLHRIVERFECVSHVLKSVTREDQSSFDLHCPLMSVPHLLGTSLYTIPNTVPYIDVPEDLAAQWRSRLQSLNGLKVGLVWAGGKKTEKDHLRSIQLAQFSPLFSANQVQFVNLQKGDPKSQITASGFPIADWMDECVDVMDTAALIANLDLVISVDTSMAHLAGALDVPVWMLNRHESEWRWLLGREDSPWYPSMKIFNQQQPGEWNSVIAKMAEELKRFSETKR